jgi:hypothetical protein
VSGCVTRSFNPLMNACYRQNLTRTTIGVNFDFEKDATAGVDFLEDLCRKRGEKQLHPQLSLPHTCHSHSLSRPERGQRRD